jgi:peptidoglycan hydrolase-like protein with peptidoglycan-binding domain
MPYQVWFADVVRSVGLRVNEVPGWRTRGSPSFEPRIVMAHGTVGARTGNMPTLQILIDGRSDLPGPLSQLGLARDGTVYVIAAGRANHAGKGRWAGTEGNTRAIGIEAESSGPRDWTDAQRMTYPVLAAALCQRLGVGQANVCSHAEYALPRGRKTDVWDLDMAAFRRRVAELLRDGVRLGPIPRVTLPERNLRQDDRGADVKAWQEDLVRFFGLHSGEQALPRFGADGHFGEETRTFTIEAQRRLGVAADGIVGKGTRGAMATWFKTRAQSEARERAARLESGAIPRVLGLDDRGDDVRAWQRDLIRFFQQHSQERALPRFGADGHFGRETRDFTIEAQKRLSVSADGLVGQVTRRALSRWFEADPPPAAEPAG